MSGFDSTMDLYRQMAANIPDCSIYIFDKNYDYLLAEGEEIAKHGFSSEMLVGANFFEVWPQEVTTLLAPYYQDTLKGIRQKIEKTSETGYFIQHFIPIHNAKSEVLAGMMVSQNVSVLTETRQKLSATSRELRSKQQLLEAVINSLSEGLIVSDKSGHVLLTNPAAQAMLNMQPQASHVTDVAKRLIIKTAPNGAELSKNEMPLSIALNGGSLNGYVTYVENRISRNKLFIENSAQPIYDDEGNIDAALLVMRNISLRKELEDLLDENLNTLKQKNEKLETLLHEIAKNLRGPTANINILLSLLDKAESDSEKQLFMEKVHGASRLLQRSVNSLSTAIIAFTSTEEEWIQNSFDAIVDDFRSEFKEELKEVGLLIKTNFHKAPTLIFPPKVLKGIIFNTLGNLTQFAASNSHPLLELRTTLGNKSTKLHVSVAGLKCDMEEIFSGDASLFGKAADFSLIGLFIAKNNLEALGGQLMVNGKNDFTISF